MRIPPQKCELCSAERRRDGRLCQSCAEMIARLSRIADEIDRQPPGGNPAGPSDGSEYAARLYERALTMNIFTVSEHRDWGIERPSSGQRPR